MQVAGRADLVKTSIVPVHPKLASTEMWSDPVVQLVLHEFQVVDREHATDCR